MADDASKLAAAQATAGYGRVTVFANVDIAPPAHRLTVLVGANGSGKSTLLRALARLHPLDTGTILLDGRAIADWSAKAAARRIGTLEQGPIAVEGMTVEDLVRQGRYPHRAIFGGWSQADQDALDEALALTRMQTLRQRPLEALSGGQRQRAWIAMTLAQQTEILLLDEPTTYLDLTHQLEVLTLLKRLVTARRATIVAVLHDLNHAARYADHIVMMHDGGIFASGSPADVMTVENVGKVFDVDVTILPDPETGAPFCIPKLHQPGRNDPGA